MAKQFYTLFLNSTRDESTKSFEGFDFLVYIYYIGRVVHAPATVHTRHSTHVEVRGQFAGVIFSFHHVGPKDGSQRFSLVASALSSRALLSPCVLFLFVLRQDLSLLPRLSFLCCPMASSTFS